MMSEDDKEEYITNKEDLMSHFENLKHGRCDECNKFCALIVPPYMVKITTKSRVDEIGNRFVRRSITGFIKACADHIPIEPYAENPPPVELNRPEGIEGIDWKFEDSQYWVREKVQVRTVSKLEWIKHPTMAERNKHRRKRRRGEVSFMEGFSVTKIPVYEYRWIPFD
ncbi:MAG: hypothetical protein CL961_00140 [Euryarchaeota archaeon]|nr:hypothetical protein [Euryarchaeota archaeon]|tara:strand:- start:507 stop:1010 length:504 start_codon:yes stop_codon:yes gene_type:complete